MRTIVDLLRRRAEDTPDHGYRHDEQLLSYRQLDRDARAVAALLQDAGVAPGARVALVDGHPLDFARAFFGCLYAGAVAVPVTARRLEAVARDCGARVALGAAGLSVRDATDPAAWRETAPAPDDLAMLQYTSGSTRDPRGVMLSHGNLLHNQELIRLAFAHGDRDAVGVSWLPLHHDMGLAAGLLQPLYVGGTSILMSPQAFLRAPAAWLRAISRHRATISGAPNFGYDLCAQKLADADVAGLDLSSWRVAFCGSEPVRPETLDRFAERLAPAGFRRDAFLPCYGLAEATLLVSGGAGRARGCGPVAGDQQVVIADDGEIWVRGGSVARGYWGRADESRATFEARLPDGSGPFLRTGDLGRLDGGELFVLGRKKDLIIARGRKHHPEDLEATALRAWPGVRAGGIVAFPSGGDDGAVLICEPRPRGVDDWNAATAVIRAAVAAEHELALRAFAVVRAGQVPRTPNGKLQRGLARRLFEAGELETLHVWRERERNDDELPVLPLDSEEDISGFLVSWLSAYLRRPVGSSTGFDSMGLDSLDVVRLTQMLGDRLGRPLAPAVALDFPSVDVLARYLAGCSSST